MKLSSITVLAGLFLIASGGWLSFPSHAAQFGVSSHAWAWDVGTGLVLLTIGVLSREDRHRR